MTSSIYSPDEEIMLATFTVDSELLGLDIMRIKEIVRPLPVTSVPRAPAGMTGVFNLRGRVLPLYDLRLRLGRPARQTDTQRDARFLIVTLDGRHLGLFVDKVDQVFTVRRGDIRLADDVLAGDAARYFVGVWSDAKRSVLLVNLHRLLEGADALPLDTLTVVVPTDPLSEGAR